MNNSLLLAFVVVTTLNLTIVYSATDNSCNGNDVTGSCSKPEKDIEEGDIDEYLNTLEQDDPILIEAIKNYYLDKGNPNFPPVIPHDRLTDRRLAGQFGQAAYVMKLYNFTKKEGFFFEAGAYDGVVVSNTLLMETMFNWTGLLVEANPDSYSRLLTANRNVFSVGHCLSTKTRPEVVLFDAADIFGGILNEGLVKPGDNIPITDRDQMIELIKDKRRTIRLQCFPIYSMLMAVGNPTVDYLSLDIEGAELAVLRSIPWDKVDIRVISLEICRKKLNENLTENHFDPYPELIALLESKGYKEVHSIPHTPEAITYESIFVRNDLELNFDK